MKPSSLEFAELREECWAANAKLPTLQLVDLTFGNVSVFDAKQSVFAIKPSGVSYAQLRREDIVVLDIEGRVASGSLKPSSDTPTHRRLYQAFPGLGAIVHTHSRNATAFAQAARSIPCLGTTHADYFFGEIPVTRPMTPEEVSGPYEWETGNVIVECFRTRGIEPLEMPAVLVHGHASFVWGENASKALECAQALEIVAEMTWKALQLDRQARPLSQFLLERHFYRKHGVNSYYGQKANSSKSQEEDLAS